MGLVLGDVTLVLDPALAKAKAALRDAKAFLYAEYTGSTGGWRFFRNLREGNVLRRLQEAINAMLVAAGCHATVKAAVEAQQRRSEEESRAKQSAPMQPLGQRDLNRGERDSPPRGRRGTKAQEGARRARRLARPPIGSRPHRKHQRPPERLRLRAPAPGGLSQIRD